MVAFHFQFSIAPGIKLTVTVVPHWSFYAFLLATMGTMVIGHYALACHRYIYEKHPSEDDMTTEAIMNHTFTVELPLAAPDDDKDRAVSLDGGDGVCPSDTTQRAHRQRWEIKQLRVTFCGKLVVCMVLVGCILAVLGGTFLHTITFEFKGLTAYLMKDPIESYSLVDIGVDMPSASGVPNNFGVRFIELAYFLFALVMPLAFLGTLLCLWVTPMSLGLQRAVVVLAEMFNAWNALDVFVVSIIASVLEIQQFAKFLVGDACDLMNKYLEEFMMDELEGDPKCFDVVSHLDTVSGLLCGR